MCVATVHVTQVKSWTYETLEMSDLLNNVEDVIVTNIGHYYTDSQQLHALSPNFFDTYVWCVWVCGENLCVCVWCVCVVWTVSAGMLWAKCVCVCVCVGCIRRDVVYMCVMYLCVNVCLTHTPSTTSVLDGFVSTAKAMGKYSLLDTIYSAIGSSGIILGQTYHEQVGARVGQDVLLQWTGALVVACV